MNIKQARQALPKRGVDVARAMRLGHKRRLLLVSQALQDIVATVQADSSVAWQVRTARDIATALQDGNADRLAHFLEKWDEQVEGSGQGVQK